MPKLYEKKPVLHAIIWILIYIFMANMGVALSKILGVDNLGNGILFLILSIVLFFYIKKNHWISYYGFQKLNEENFKKTYFYIPFLLLIILNGITGFNSELKVIDILSILLFMGSVGFLEELIFRGFLYKAILAKGNVVKAILISGITFGLGHIVNLFNGYTGTEQIMQIIGATAIGIMLTVIFQVTGNIIPGMIFHFMFNFVSSISKDASLKINIICLILMAVTSVVYTIYLFKFVHRDDIKQAI